MITSTFKGISVAGIMTVVPKNKEMIMERYAASFGSEAVEQFTKTTGVLERRLALKEQTASDFAFVAARELLVKKEIDKNDIGILIFVTQTPDYRIPSTACVLHKRLELGKDCIAFDINLGCSGYVYGMQVASSLLMTTNCKYALLLVGDTINKGISQEDKSAAMLFGDSGSATLLEKKQEDSSVIKTAYRTDGNGFKAIIMPAGGYRNLNGSNEKVVWADGNSRSDNELYMNGVDVFSFTISEVPAIINDYFEVNGKNKEDYDVYVMHQANCYILKQVVKRCKLPKEKVPISMDRYGNTSVTSIPLTLSDIYGEDADEKQIKCFVCGFGIGLSWGVAEFEMNKKDIYPIMETDEAYADGGVSHE